MGIKCPQMSDLKRKKRTRYERMFDLRDLCVSDRQHQSIKLTVDLLFLLFVQIVHRFIPSSVTPNIHGPSKRGVTRI